MALYSEKPSYMGAKLFNILAEEIKLQEESIAFKKGLRQIVELYSINSSRNTIVRSKSLPLKRGVPQGSVLSPFMHNCGDKYADGTTLLFKNETAQNLISEITLTIDKVLQYCLYNDLAINPLKTTQINFSRKSEKIRKIPNISTEQKTKFLGNLALESIWFCRMKWIGVLVTAEPWWNPTSDMDGLIVWEGTFEHNLKKYLSFRKKALRAIASITPMERCREAYKNLKILIVTALAVNYLLPPHHTTKYTKNPSYVGRKFYNSLPENLKCLQRTTLQRQLYNWLVQRPV
ncbi:hypothetical protein J6590_018265 [Homalodisca vitripennis]|nr:hypothetical protein J6590_018265 [Homalodisca vitripennis]